MSRENNHEAQVEKAGQKNEMNEGNPIRTRSTAVGASSLGALANGALGNLGEGLSVSWLSDD